MKQFKNVEFSVLFSNDSFLSNLLACPVGPQITDESNLDWSHLTFITYSFILINSTLLRQKDKSKNPIKVYTICRVSATKNMTCPCDRIPPMTRSRSWPMLYTVPEEEVTCSGSGAVAVAAVGPRLPDDGAAHQMQLQQQQQHQHQHQQHAVTVPVANVGRLLRRHYYPEAGWGWVVVTCACLVHVLNHGLQLSFGELEKDVIQRFRDSDYSGTGQFDRYANERTDKNRKC